QQDQRGGLFVVALRLERLGAVRLGAFFRPWLALARTPVLLRIGRTVAAWRAVELLGLVRLLADRWLGGIAAAAEVRRALHALQHHPALQFAIRSDCRNEGVGCAGSDLDEGFILLHLDRADLVLGDLADAAQHRDDPARLGIL